MSLSLMMGAYLGLNSAGRRSAEESPRARFFLLWHPWRKCTVDQTCWDGSFHRGLLASVVI